MKNLRRTLLLVLLFLGLLTVFFWAFPLSKTAAPEAPGGEAVLSLPAPEPEPVPELSVAAVGDVMLARKLTPLMAANGTAYPFAKTVELIKTADIAFANLESPVSTRGEKLPGKGIWFRAKPENAAALSLAGFDVLSLANNHALDYQTPAFLDTITFLDGMKIKHAGGGKNISEARSPAIIEAGGMKVAFLAYSEMADLIWSSEHPRRLKATADTSGIAPLVRDEIIADIAGIRPQVDMVFISLHWGVEYSHMPEDYQRRIAHQLVEAGADVILGNHPHCIQGLEIYKKGLIAYSLGNFVFDQNWSEDTKSGLMLQLKCGPSGWQEARVLPVYINDGQPVIAQGNAGAGILGLTQEISERLGSKMTINEGQGTFINRAISKDNSQI